MYESSNKYMFLGAIVSFVLIFLLAFSIKKYEPKKFKKKNYQKIKMKIIKKNLEDKKKDIKKLDKKESKEEKKIIPKKDIKKIKKKKIKKRKKIKTKKKIKKIKKIIAKNPINQKKEEKKPSSKKENKTTTPIFGVSMNSLSNNKNSFSVKAGNTLMTDDSTGKNLKLDKNSQNYIPPEIEKPKKKLIKTYKITKKPIPKKVFKPKYTKLAIDEEIEGKIILKLKIDKFGNVVNAKIIKGLGYGLDEEAIKAARKFKFSPAVLENNKTTQTTIVYMINFVLEE